MTDQPADSDQIEALPEFAAAPPPPRPTENQDPWYETRDAWDQWAEDEMLTTQLRRPLMLRGTVNVPSAATSFSQIAVTFPPGIITVPLVFVTIATGGASDRLRRVANVNGVTVNGCNIGVHDTSGAALGNATTVYWLVVNAV